MANVYLPSLNADIIDKGVAKGDTGYIISTGGWMLAVTLVQIACSIAAVYFGARAAMSFGRDVRSAIFPKVGTFSGREVAQFGAPSLITRNTNDVQQVQMLVLMTCTLMVAAPIMCVGGIIMALRQDIGLSWLMLVSIPALVVAIGLIVVRMVPQFRLMQARIDTVNRVLRAQLSGIRRVRGADGRPGPDVGDVDLLYRGAADRPPQTLWLGAGRDKPTAIIETAGARKPPWLSLIPGLFAATSAPVSNEGVAMRAFDPEI